MLKKPCYRSLSLWIALTFALTLISSSQAIAKPQIEEAQIEEAQIEEAQREFSNGKKFYNSGSYPQASEAFVRSFKHAPDHKSLYYLALSRERQLLATSEVLKLWIQYHQFCLQENSSCAQVWIKKARSHRARIEGILAYEQKQYTQARSQLSDSIKLTPHDRALYYQALATDRNQALCASRFKAWEEYRNHCKDQECLSQELKSAQREQKSLKKICKREAICPKQTVQHGQACIPCLITESWSKERGCFSSNLLRQPSQSSKSSSQNIFTQISWWTYSSLLLALTSHALNVTIDSPTLIDITYYTAIGAYSLSTFSLGLDLYDLAYPATSPTSSSSSSSNQAHLPHHLNIPSGSPKMLTLWWSGTF